MAKKKSKQSKPRPDALRTNQPWIPLRSGLIIMGVVSLALTIFTIWQTYGPLTFAESLRYGLVRGGSLWVIFAGALFLNRWLRGR